MLRMKEFFRPIVMSRKVDEANEVEQAVLMLGGTLVQ
jgi:hypothetical protein